MQKIYKTKHMVLIIIQIILIGNLKINAQPFPVPDMALTFDDTQTTWHSIVTDVSGKNNNGYWSNYWDGTQDMYAKYFPAAGVFGGAWYMSGYHACCTNMASSSMDFILLAGNKNVNKDVAGFKEESPLFHTGFNAMTIAFWHKSDRNYAGNNTPCPPVKPDMHEQELLVSIGNRNGIQINNFKGYYEVRIGQKNAEVPGVQKGISYLWNGTSASSGEWHHIAITYDGADNGKLSVYLDGQLGIPYLGDPNPLSTGFSELLADPSSSEIGAQNAGGLFGDPGNGYWGTSAVGLYCVTVADTSKYRTGWPANGYFDDFVFYKNKALTLAEIQQLKLLGIKKLLPTLAVSPSGYNQIKIYPNPSCGLVSIQSPGTGIMNLKVYNLLGALVHEKTLKADNEIDLTNLNKGIYILRIDNQYTEKLILK